MSAANKQITIEQGATFTMGLSFNEPPVSGASCGSCGGCSSDAPCTPGDPIDVSTWVFEGQIRTTYSSADIVASFVFTAGLTTNAVVATIPDSVTLTIPVKAASNFQINPTYYCYDIKATRPDNVVIAILEGAVAVVPTVTR